MTEVLKPTMDLVFKALFGQENSERILASFLSAVLGWEQIQSLTYKDPIYKIEDIDDKHPILDVRVQTQNGEHVNIEVQVGAQKYFERRSLYYWSRIYGTQLDEGDNYGLLQKTISINLLDFVQFKDKNSYHSTYFIKDNQTNDLLTDHLEIHFIELPKFHGKIQSVLQSGDSLNQWLYFLKYADDLNEEEVFQMEQTVQEAYDKLKVISGNPDFKIKLEARLKQERDARQKELDAMEQGREEGIEIGAWRTTYGFLAEELVDAGIDLALYEEKLKKLDINSLKTLLRKWKRAPKSQVISELDSL